MNNNGRFLSSIKFPIALLLILVLGLFFLNRQNIFTTQETSLDQPELTNLLFSIPDSSVHEFELSGNQFMFEVVNTPASKTQGLSGRDEIGSDGMLFVFNQPDFHGIWMKEMRFDLDLIWMLDGKIVSITRGVPAPQTTVDALNLPVYRPETPANLVLEVEAGFAESHNIAIGDELTILMLE